MTASRLSFVMGVNWPNRRSPHSKTLALGYDKAPQQATSKTFFCCRCCCCCHRHRSHSYSVEAQDPDIYYVEKCPKLVLSKPGIRTNMKTKSCSIGWSEQHVWTNSCLPFSSILQKKKRKESSLCSFINWKRKKRRKKSQSNQPHSLYHSHSGMIPDVFILCTHATLSKITVNAALADCSWKKKKISLVRLPFQNKCGQKKKTVVWICEYNDVAWDHHTGQSHFNKSRLPANGYHYRELVLV